MILVTGFGPYKEDKNASGEVVLSLDNDAPEELLAYNGDLAFEVINCDNTSRETEHQSLETQLFELLARYEPELCIHTGQAPPYDKITIERIATNSFMSEVINQSGPVAYWSNLPGNGSIKDILEEKDIPAEYSFYAGQHLCNHILYSSLYFSEKHCLSHKSGFIHIPLLPDQVAGQHRNSPYMPIEMSRKALALVINHVVEAHRRNKALQLTAENGG